MVDNKRLFSSVVGAGTELGALSPPPLWLSWHRVCLPVIKGGNVTPPLGLDTLYFYFCLLFYSLMLASHAYYASKVNLLFSNYAQKVHKQNISFSIVLKHDRN